MILGTTILFGTSGYNTWINLLDNANQRFDFIHEWR